MEEAQKLTKKAQKAVESSNRNADQASQQVKNISKPESQLRQIREVLKLKSRCRRYNC